MAKTRLGTALTEAQRRHQLALRASVLRQVLRQWSTWDIHDTDSYVALQDALVAITQVNARRSATLAGEYYRMFRLAEQPRLATDVAARIMLAEPPTVEQIKTAIDATAKTGVYNAFKYGKSYDEALANGLVKVSGAIGRLVLNGGRDTIISTVREDKQVVGWARATSGDPCAFCAMVASRGPVYSKDTVDFEAHDHCSCVPEPVYERSLDAWPEHSREWRELWEDTGSLKSFRQELTAQQAQMPAKQALPTT